MKLAKSIDELYEEVRGFDIVVCNDAPLALALNNRLDEPRIGVFATTPRELAGDLSLKILGRGTLSEINLVKRISERTGYKLRYVHGEVENIKKIRRYTADVRVHLGFRSKKIYDEYVKMPTLDRVMEECDAEGEDLFGKMRVAVIGGELYDDLDKHFNPKFGTYEEVSPFKYGTYSINEIRELSNDRQIAENAVNLINEGNAEDVAIVMDVKGHIADAVRSALYRRGMPFINSLNVKDLNHIRDFLEFLSLSLSFETIKVKQARELISTYRGNIWSKYDEYRISQYVNISTDSERTMDLMRIMRDIRNMRFIDVCEKVVSRREAPQVKILLKEMDLTDSPITEKDVDEIMYAVNNIGDLKHNEQIPESEKEGVLLVDCTRSVYIDRPVVIFLGMGTEWDRDLSELDFLKAGPREDENEKDLVKFQILLQQGSKRVYICNSMKDGRTPKPSMMFGQCMDGGPVNSFRDVCGNMISGPWYRNTDAPIIRMGIENPDEEPYIPRPFSKTSYNSYVSCPRRFMYMTLLRSPDKSSTVVGDLIHQYAEFRICNPELAKKKDAGFYTDIIADRSTGLYPPEIRSIERSKIWVSLNNIDRFADRLVMDRTITTDNGIREKKSNIFLQSFNVQGNSYNTEVKYVSGESHMEGIFDLIVDDTIYDYKTGKPAGTKSIVDGMDLKNKGIKEFQCMFYLSLLDEIAPEGKKEFALLYTMDNDSKMVHGSEYNIEDNLRHVYLIPSKRDYIDGAFKDELLNTARYRFLGSCWDVFVNGAMSVGIDDPEELLKDETVADEIASAINERTKKIRDSVKAAMKKVSNNVSGKEIFRSDRNRSVFVTRKALDDFRKDVWQNFSEAERFYSTEYPARPLIKCEKCDFMDLCTAIPIEGGEEDVDIE
ncbi:MAG: PD-(D/E)XK nuclease family protein [Candidatus Methanomethylophilaceae archaeon]